VFATTNEWIFLGNCNGKLYAEELQKGLCVFENNSFKPVECSNGLPPKSQIANIIDINNDSAIITTLKNGLFLFTKNVISKILSPNNSIFENQRIYASTKVNDNRVALATNNNGVYIIDLKGNIIQSFGRKEGLQNNNVLSIFKDAQSNLWLGLDNGIDLVAYNSAIKQINPFLQDGSGYTAIIDKNILYLGTANGLYGVTLQQTNDLSFSKGNFTAINNAKGQNWGLASINNQLLLGHHEGAFVIDNFNAKQILSTTGFWNFMPLSNTFPTVQMIAGNYKGLSYFNYVNGSFIKGDDIDGFKESSRFIAIDADDYIWVSHPYHGIHKIIKLANKKQEVHTYTSKHGLPSDLNNHIYKIKNEIIIATENGIYKYNQDIDRFEPSIYYKKILGNQSIRYLKEDAQGNIWFIHEKKLGVIDFSHKVPTVVYIPELNNKLLSGFDFIYPVNQNNIFLGGEKGFYHLNYEKYKQALTKIQVQIRSVKITSDTDSLLFGGYFKAVNEKQVQDNKDLPTIKSNYKTIHFEFATTQFGSQSNLEYSYRLKGFDNNWSTWNKQTSKEYTNIPAGKYVFEVKVRSNLNLESEIATYTFIILPPWYFTIWAKIGYFLLFVSFNYLLYQWQRKKFRLQQTKYEQEQKKIQYIHELELSKTESELVALKNDKLESEIDFKNSELASTAMHLVKKGELLSKIKSELTLIMRSYDNPQATGEIKKLLKSLGEDENIDKEWEAFSKHFDRVHNDFLTALKQKHPNITPSELKLSAYLNMNLSTKEIAQLMNISVRGVEISRYRLRKKLEIPTELSLFDYMMSISVVTK
jgi:DNA-binding CsgD family transcriptional regulator